MYIATKIPLQQRFHRPFLPMHAPSSYTQLAPKIFLFLYQTLSSFSFVFFL